VPVQATGFNDLQLRLKAQDERSGLHQKALQEIDKQLQEMQRQHEVNTVVKIEQYRQQSMVLAHRLIKVIHK